MDKQNAVLTTMLENFARRSKNFAHCPKTTKKKQIYQKIVSSQSVRMDKQDAVVTSMPDRFARRSKNFAPCQKMIKWKIYLFQEKIIFLKTIRWLPRKEISQHLLKVFSRRPETFLWTSKSDKNYKVFKKNVFHEVLLWTRKMQIWQSYSNTFRRTVESISLNNQKRLGKLLISQKVHFYSECTTGHVESCYNNSV